MAATYTDDLKITKQGDNDNPNSWGDVVNSQVTELFEEAVAGIATIDVTGSSDVTLTITNGTASSALDQGRNMILKITGTITANINLIVPSIKKLYVIHAAYTSSPAGFNVTVKNSSGTGASLTPTFKGFIYNDGTNVTSLVKADPTYSASDITYDHSLSGLTASNVQTAVDEVVANLIPVGTVVAYAGPAPAPSGWLLCYGQSLSTWTYADLYAVIGTTYGSGTGTFNLPDYRGRVLAGLDNMGGSSANRLTDKSGGLDGDVLGDYGGSETHTLTMGEIQHRHESPGLAEDNTSNTWTLHFTNTSIFPRTSRNVTATKAGGVGGNSQSIGTVYSNVAETYSTDTPSAHNNVQPTITVNYIIKY